MNDDSVVDCAKLIWNRHQLVWNRHCL